METTEAYRVGDVAEVEGERGNIVEGVFGEQKETVVETEEAPYVNFAAPQPQDQHVKEFILTLDEVAKLAFLTRKTEDVVVAEYRDRTVKDITIDFDKANSIARQMQSFFRAKE